MKVYGVRFVVIAIAALVICTGNSFAYIVEWDDVQYYAGAQVNGNEWDETYESDTAEAYDEGDDEDYASALSSLLHFDAGAFASSDDTGEAHALSLRYGIIAVQIIKN